MNRVRGTALVVCTGLALLTASGSPGGEVPDVTARVTTNQLAVSLRLDPVAAEQGRTVRARAEVTNAGAQALTAVSATLRLDPTGIALPSTTTVTLGTLEPQRSTTVTWEICGRDASLYVLLAQALGTRADGYELVTESDATVLAVSAGRAQCR